MALRHALLAALLDGEASGYELSKRFDASVSHYWSASRQQLYRELERLEAAGLVRGRLVRQVRRPDKRSFVVTQAGMEELRNFITATTRPAVIRDDLLVKLQAAAEEDLPTLRDAVVSRLNTAEKKLAFYNGTREAMLKGRTEDDYLRHGRRPGTYLTLMAGRLYEMQNVQWCKTVLEVIEHRMAKD